MKIPYDAQERNWKDQSVPQCHALPNIQLPVANCTGGNPLPCVVEQPTACSVEQPASPCGGGNFWPSNNNESTSEKKPNRRWICTNIFWTNSEWSKTPFLMNKSDGYTGCNKPPKTRNETTLVDASKFRDKGDVTGEAQPQKNPGPLRDINGLATLSLQSWQLIF